MLCAASVEERVPAFLKGTGSGWVTAEYGMLPRATHTRSAREAATGKQGGRTQEIQRLIGRSLRSVTELRGLGERTITLDCDVLEADGGTRCAAITGACVALAMALAKLVRARALSRWPLRETVAATSVGICAGQAVLDLAYAEDSEADVDCNIVGTASGAFVEIQAERPKRCSAASAEEQLAELAPRWSGIGVRSSGAQGPAPCKGSARRADRGPRPLSFGNRPRRLRVPWTPFLT